jgi:hypothetical protein
MKKYHEPERAPPSQFSHTQETENATIVLDGRVITSGTAINASAIVNITKNA